jgi:hypothetical protein
MKRPVFFSRDVSHIMVYSVSVCVMIIKKLSFTNKMDHYKILILGLKQMFHKQIIHTIKQSLFRQLAVMVEEKGKKKRQKKKETNTTTWVGQVSSQTG